MDIKPTLLTELERQTRKAEELRKRGYSRPEIIAAMGLSPTQAGRLLGPAAARPSPRPARPPA